MQNNSTPAVSVLIDTYNQAHFLEQAVCSVLQQGLSPSELEILIVDDGSTDNTAALAAKFAPRVQYLRKSNGGQISAYNFAISQTRAPIIAFLDADDWWVKTKLQIVLDEFSKDSTVTAVGHGFIQYFDQTRTEEPCLPAKTYRFDLSTPANARFAHAARRFLSTSKMAVRRSVVEAAGTLPDQLVFFDVGLQVAAMALGPAVVLNQPLTFYRVHRENLYESRRPDAKNLRRKLQCLNAQLEFFPGMLARLGVSPEAVAAILLPDELDRDRLRIDLEGGWPWDAFRLERRRFLAKYEKPTPAYAAFKWLALAPALFMPPATYYRARDWYFRHNLRRFRKFTGEPIPAAELDIRNSPVQSN